MKYPGKIRIIGGKWRSRLVPVLSAESLRPTPDRVRETLFNWLQGDIADAYCVDLFAGTGILGFEALSRGANNVVMIDQASEVIHTLSQVANDLQIDGKSLQIINQNVLKWLASYTGKPADILFLDPPFNSNLLEESLKLLEKSPLLGKNTLIYVEAPATASIISLPNGWQPIRSKVAASVGYHLLAYREA